MIAFAELVERLAQAPHDAAKRAWLRHYFGSVPDPDRGWALAAMAGALDLPAAGPGLLRRLAAARCDPALFALSHEYVGELAETLALMWPGSDGRAPRLGEVVTGLQETPKRDLPTRVAAWLDACPPSARRVLLRLVTGHLRVGAGLGLAKEALADMSEGRVGVGDIEAVWHTLSPPYETLFAWVEGVGPRPEPRAALPFFAPMLAGLLDETALGALPFAEFVAEWQWDGARVQLQAGPEPRLLSRTGEAIEGGVASLAGEAAVLDGMLLQVGGRIGLHDMLFEGGEDLRAWSFRERRRQLEAWFARVRPNDVFLSPLLAFEGRNGLLGLREEARAMGAMGLMLKRLDAPYVAGRHAGAWWKFKLAPITFAAVLMYVEGAPGREGAITVGVWDGGRLVPLGRAEDALGAEERAFLDAFVEDHVCAKFGPVREVEPSLVLHLACEGVVRSPRRRAGVALRRPRVVGLCCDADPASAATLADVLRWVTPGRSPTTGGIATA